MKDLHIDVDIDKITPNPKPVSINTGFEHMEQMIRENNARPIRHLAEINRNTQQTAENTSEINSKVESLNLEVAELYATVAQLRTELDDERKRSAEAVEAERKRADKAVERSKWFTFFMTIFSVFLSYLLNH